MKKIVIGLTIIMALAIIVIGGWMYKSNSIGQNYEPVNNPPQDARNATYIIEGSAVVLKNGLSETVLPDSASKIFTRYFGNEIKADFNADGMEDSAFLLTQARGGSGTFYYIAALLGAKGGFTGTNTILLGDRIAPQTTEFRDGLIIVNYADRKPGESFSVQPSMGVSRYFKIISGELKEIILKISESEARAIAEASCIKGGKSLAPGYYNENSETWWFDANLNATKEGCSSVCVVGSESKTAELSWMCTGAIPPPPNETPCDPSQRNAEVCAEIYAPVCATVEIRCIRAPCNPIKETFGNSCEACRNSLVRSYTQGECAE